MSNRPRAQDEAKRIPLLAKVLPDVKRVVEEIAEDEDRSVSNMVERLLSESPRVKRKLSQLSVVG